MFNINLGAAPGFQGSEENKSMASSVKEKSMYTTPGVDKSIKKAEEEIKKVSKDEVPVEESSGQINFLLYIIPIILILGGLIYFYFSYDINKLLSSYIQKSDVSKSTTVRKPSIETKPTLSQTYNNRIQVSKNQIISKAKNILNNLNSNVRISNIRILPGIIQIVIYLSSKTEAHKLEAKLQESFPNIYDKVFYTESSDDYSSLPIKTIAQYKFTGEDKIDADTQHNYYNDKNLNRIIQLTGKEVNIKFNDIHISSKNTEKKRDISISGSGNLSSFNRYISKLSQNNLNLKYESLKISDEDDHSEINFKINGKIYPKS